MQFRVRRPSGWASMSLAARGGIAAKFIGDPVRDTQSDAVLVGVETDLERLGLPDRFRRLRHEAVVLVVARRRLLGPGGHGQAQGDEQGEEDGAYHGESMRLAVMRAARRLLAGAPGGYQETKVGGTDDSVAIKVRARRPIAPSCEQHSHVASLDPPIVI